MEALIIAFIAAAAAEWGDRAQRLVAAIAFERRRPGAAVAGLVLGAACASSAAASAGLLLHDILTPRAATLFVACALLVAGGAGLFKAKTPGIAHWRAPPVLIAALGSFAALLAGSAVFVTAAVAALFDSFALAAAGATAGIVAAALPAVALGPKLPTRGLRMGIATMFLVIAVATGAGALRLV
jgi:putative Ca2+/H+ antiporter (TMEM165/GDT1 family)